MIELRLNGKVHFWKILYQSVSVLGYKLTTLLSPRLASSLLAVMQVRVLYARFVTAVLLLDIVWDHKLDLPIKRVREKRIYQNQHAEGTSVQLIGQTLYWSPDSTSLCFLCFYFRRSEKWTCCSAGCVQITKSRYRTVL